MALVVGIYRGAVDRNPGDTKDSRALNSDELNVCFQKSETG